MSLGSAQPVRVLGRYVLYSELASGGMATVHYGRLMGPVGFSRTVAIKRLHAQFAKDPEFVSMFLDEARLAARIRHPNVVQTLDVVALDDEVFLVMEYVQGESFARLLREARRAQRPIPPEMVAAICVGALNGLHAAHEATSERGEPLNVIHRDVSPQNILVGSDGVARLLDFGVAKAAGAAHSTRDGQLKGKVAYMAPEQIRGSVTRATDIYASGVVLWEAFAGRRLFSGESDAEILAKVLDGAIEPPSKYAPGLPPAIDALVACALERDPKNRFATAREMARMLEKSLPLVSSSDVGEWVEQVAGVSLADRARRIATIESDSHTTAAISFDSEIPPPHEEAITTELSSSSLTDPSRPDPSFRRRAASMVIVGVIGAAVVGLLLTIVAIGVGRSPAPTAVLTQHTSSVEPPPADSVPEPPLAVSSETASVADPATLLPPAANSVTPPRSPSTKAVRSTPVKRGFGSALDSRR